MASKHAGHAQIFKAFSDENRLMILEILRRGEQSATDLLEELCIAQSTLSHHMKILCGASIVQSRREGKRTHYSLDRSGCDEVVALLARLVRP